MPINLRFGRPDPLNFDKLVKEFRDSEFETLTRSTVPLLCYWSQCEQRLAGICDQIGCGVPEDFDVCFEYPVPAWEGNTPSYTDVMCTSRDLGIAIEGKSTEGRYESVCKWLGPQPSKNKQGVLNNWLQMIGQKTGLAVEGTNFDPFLEVTYQMIHRTASACSLGASRTVVVYQVFESANRPPCH